MKLISMFAALALTAGGAGAANAATTVFTSSAAFNAAIAGHQIVEDFSSGVGGQAIANGGSFNGNVYTTPAGQLLDGTIITNLYSSFSGVSLGGNQSGYAQFFFSGDSVTVTFAKPVYAVGVFFNVNPGSGDFILKAAGTTTSTGSAVYDVSSFVFDGLVSDTRFTRATFTSTDDGRYSASFTIPKIITAAAAAVPEPATWAMMLLGFGGLGAVLRHRKAGLAA